MEMEGSLDLSKFTTVLVKFSFTNPKHVPSGVPLIQRPTNEEIDAKHAADQKYLATHSDQSLGEKGRHREGRVDTGEPVIKDLQAVQAMLLKRDLVGAGFKLSGFRYWKQQRDEKSVPKWVVQCQFTKTDGPVEHYPAHVAATIQSLVSGACWAAHVWANPNGVATINFVGRQPGVKPKNYLVVGGGQYVMGVAA